jgi:hypothetical protein
MVGRGAVEGGWAWWGRVWKGDDVTTHIVSKYYIEAASNTTSVAAF